jgi:hypothetical protein
MANRLGDVDLRELELWLGFTTPRLRTQTRLLQTADEVTRTTRMKWVRVQVYVFVFVLRLGECG